VRSVGRCDLHEIVLWAGFLTHQAFGGGGCSRRCTAPELRLQRFFSSRHEPHLPLMLFLRSGVFIGK